MSETLSRLVVVAAVGFAATQVCVTSSIQASPLAAGAFFANSAQQSTRALKENVATGQLTVLVQDTFGEPFVEGATVTLLTNNIEDKLLEKSNESGHALFTTLPVGQYLLEIAAPGYRTVQEEVFISSTNEAQNVLISMVPNTSATDVKAVSPKAVKETEKALHALQLNKLDDAQQHLSRALAIDPNFADGNYLMGVVLLRQKQFQQAASHLQKAIDLSPSHSAALLALGETEYFEHDYSRSSQSLARFLRDQPHSRQAPVAQQYLDAIHKLQLPNALGATEIAKTDLSPFPEITPVTETNWAPPDVDDEKVDLDSTTGCELADVMKSAGNRVQELVQNISRFTATEQIEHFNLSPMGLETSRETRKFDYLVEIRLVGNGDIDVQEYRNGSVATQNFPGHIATVGLPSLALIFHPHLQSMYEFRCEGRGSWRGKPTWVVHFQQRTDRPSAMLVYHVGNNFFAVGLKGRAWIDAHSSQILAMESDIVKPVPEIRLLRDHQLIEYGPVSFRSHSTKLWLPKSADWYCSLSGRHFHRRHTFSQFLLFAVEDNEKVMNPKEAAKPPE
ncbi:MAG: tetratricopeptide repeat protein [Candidatus Acidiferrum sp.]